MLLDVRQAWETRLARLENAIHIPIEEIVRKTVKEIGYTGPLTTWLREHGYEAETLQTAYEGERIDGP